METTMQSKAMKNVAPQSTAIVTIVSNNYLHFARTMLQSAKRHHADAQMYCVIVDIDLSHAAALSSEFEAISIEKLNLPLGEEFLFQYSILELNTAVKPLAIEYLLDLGHGKVIYVDPDIYFYRPMAEVELMLASGTDILLTPHLLAPVTDDKTPSELDIRRAGTYNFGFCAVRGSTNTRNFLHWWQKKLVRDCVVDLNRGIFVDQSWIDLVPGLFENVGILRHPGYNVAYWNIAQRPLSKDGKDSYLIGNAPLVFFHFSGLDPFRPAAFSKHQNRFTLPTLGLATALVESYVKAVMQNGAEKYALLKYGFGHFTSGDKIPDSFRKLYRTSGKIRQQMGAHPFQHSEAMNDPYADVTIDGLSPTNAMAALWADRQDLQAVFPLKTADSIQEYYQWFVSDPSLKDLFPDAVISHHQEVNDGLLEIAHFGTQSGGQKDISGREAHRVHRLYASILNRKVDPQGFRIYSELCGTNLGYLRAWRYISMSEESRKKPNLIFRMLKALFFSI